MFLATASSDDRETIGRIDPTEGAATAFALARCDVAAMDELLHGSTIAINTVLERSGAVTALVTTEGFRDVR